MTKEDRLEKQLEQITEYLTYNTHYIPLIHKICCVEGKRVFEQAPKMLKYLEESTWYMVAPKHVQKRFTKLVRLLKFGNKE